MYEHTHNVLSLYIFLVRPYLILCFAGELLSLDIGSVDRNENDNDSLSW